MISLLVVSVDFKLSECCNPLTEHSSFRSHEPNAVIRLFGSTDRGLRICAHIHGFMPYIYFRPEEMHDVVFESEESLSSYLPRMEKTLEELLRKRYESTNSSNRANFKRIKKLEMVRRKTIYGFYSEIFLFVKVFLRDPNDISKLATILDEGGLCGICMQAYEGHIPYLLKFTCDLNIAPMGWITLKDVQYRSKSDPLVPNSSTGLEKESSCELEVDAHFKDIEIVESEGFGSELWEEERIRCEKKFLEPDRQPTPPSTLTNHRTKTSSECNYIQRLRNLMEKGQTLMRVNQHIQAAVVNPSSTPTNPSPVMSQIGQAIANSPIGALKSRSISFKRDSIDANDSSRLFSSPSPSVLGAGLGVGMLSPDILRLTPESNVYRWVVSTIKKSEEQVVQSGQLFDRLLTEDPVNVAEEFVIRSQVSEDQDKKVGLNDKAATNAVAVSSQKLVECEAATSLLEVGVACQNAVSVYDTGANADDDEVHTAEEIQAEVENILQSTQPADAFATNLTKASSQNHPRSIAQSSSSSGSSSGGHNNHNNYPQTNMIDSVIINHDAKDHRDSKASSMSKPPLPRVHKDVSSTKTTIRKHDLGSRDAISSSSPDSHASSLHPSFTATSFLNVSSNTPSSSPYLRLEKKNSNLTLGSVFNPNRKRKLTSSISSAAMDSPADADSLNPNLNLFPGDSPPIGIAQVNDEVRSAFKSSNKKLNRTVSFLEPTPGSSAIAQQSYGSYDSNSVDDKYLVENFSFISDSPIAVSSLTNVDRYEALVLQPTFDAPAVSQLTPIHVYGLPDLVNPPIVWSNKADLIQAKDTNSAFHSIVSRHAVKFKNDAEEFDGGFPDLSDDEQDRSKSGFPKKPPCPVARVRCLVPLFSPPPPSEFWQSLCTDGDQRNDLNREKKFSPASPTVSNTQKYAKSQINSPTQTQVRVMKRKGGNAIQREDLIGKGNLTARKSRTSVMSVEILCEVRQGYLPNPKFDPVKCICWVINDKVSDSESESTQKYQGMICVDLQAIQTEGASNSSMITMKYKSCGLPPLFDIQIVPTEAQLFELFVNIVGEADPDFFIGYDVNRNSFGYLVKRGKVLNINLLQLLSKVPNEPPNFRNNTGEEEDSMYGQGEPSILITGRILLNLWNYMRSELKLMSYTYASVAEHVLSISMPYYTTSQLSRWFHSTVSRHRALRHLYNLTELNLLLIEKVDMVRKTAECARLYGIDFTSVLTRGSQYRVEASLLKKAHAFGYLLITPSRKRVAAQAPMEVIPLVMEPQSGFYKDPVVVLDFQSLYPSMIIAYNLCYSTCIGKMVPIERRRVEEFDGEEVEADTTGRLGVVRYPEVQSALSSIMHHQNPNLNGPGDHGSDGPSIQALAESGNAPYVSPNGSAFCSKSVRLGILPMMCKEMLETRIMLKRAMKRHKDESSGVLSKVLDARQLAVKLLSNVTYGYTAAGFSGRMPMAELADAVVQSGRSTLEWTIQYIQSHPDWRARVVYGDTDSVFVELQGRSKEEAFRIGNEIAQEITSKSPADVLLKFEKVYFPCVLVTKKRYVGCSYETLTQPPHLDAKGIEMVRRDQCPAAMKMQEKALRLLFDSRDASCVKKYLLSQWEKMVQGGDRLLLRDFIFRKEVRFGHYANISSQPPGAIVATKQVLLDDMAVPPYNWRVPYVVVHGVPNAPLKNLVFSPEEVLRRGSPLRVNYNYYIHKCINPALDRVLSLCGLDVSSWFRGMARPRQRLRHFNYDTLGSADERILALGNGANNMLTRKKQTTMDQFTTRGSCEICGERDALPQRSLCGHCSDNRMSSLITLTERLKALEVKSQQLAEICHDCAQCPQPADLFMRGQMVGCESCESLDCVVFHERCRLVTRMEDAKMSVAEIEDLGR